MTSVRTLWLTLSVLVLALALTLGTSACSSDAPQTCSYGGKAYAAGETFPSSDGCNSCACGANGAVGCTTRACLPDAGPDGNADGGGDTPADGGAAVDVPAATDVSAGDDAAGAVDGASDLPAAVDLGAGDDASSDVNPLCRFGAAYTFGLVGGLVASTDESVLSPPNHYHHVRMRFGSDAGTTTCDAVADCEIMNSLGLVDVVAGLQDADVQAALSQTTPLLYGRDSRPFDGQVYSIKRADGRGLLVGTPCTGGQLDCRDIPSGITLWVKAWKEFDARMLTRTECGGL